MIIRISLLLMFAALSALFSADLLLWQAWPVLPELITRLGLVLLFSAFILLLVAGLLTIAKQIINACLDYFSAKQRIQRKLLFIQAKQEQLRSLFHFRTLHINYFNNLQRKRLLIANNRKHIRLLSKTIDKDLLLVKQHLPKSTYLQLKRENSFYLNREDSEGLLKLQQKISAMG
ncbi:MAG: hypothetical protein ACXW1W_04080 [Methylococcaceae bacterium]